MTLSNELLTAQGITSLPLRERVGLVFNSINAQDSLQAILAAEGAGVRQVWTTQGPTSMDALTLYAVAATQTTTIRMGTSILPTYPRHPLAVVAQVRSIDQLAPGRLRLGVGASHRPTIQGLYGLAMDAPLEHLREYVGVLRAALWEGKVEHQGRFFNVSATLREPSRVPILMAALGQKAFQAAGEIADGALSWACPVPYLLQTAVPALQSGAEQAGRPVPPLLAHVPVALGTDRGAVLAAARKRLGYYGRLPFYQHMFAQAGYPIPEDGSLPDDLVDRLVVSGDEAAVATRLSELLSGGLSELVVQHIIVQEEASEWQRLAHLIGRL